MGIKALRFSGYVLGYLHTVVKKLEKSTNCHRFGKYCQKLGSNFPHYIPSSLVSKILEWNGKN